jgi:hypothetical protein
MDTDTDTDIGIFGNSSHNFLQNKQKKASFLKFDTKTVFFLFIKSLEIDST